MRYVAGEEVSYYLVTGISDPSPAKNLSIGDVLIDHNRGKHTEWEFVNKETLETSGWIVGKRLGKARVNDELKPVPYPKLQAKLDAMKEALDAADA